MYAALAPGAVGVSAPNLDAAVDAARRGGFAGVEVNAKEIADLVDSHGADAVRAKLGEILPAGFGFPLEWRGDEGTWRDSLAELPRLAAACAAIGLTRTTTWILPFSKDLQFWENFRFHAERMREGAAILADHGIRFGLEYIGPKTLRAMGPHEFIYTQDGMLELAREIGPNVGLLVDCWHWYTSGGTVADLARLTPEQVVYVHVNDAPAGVPVDEQLDNVRRLPGDTGVIDIAGFLETLRPIYDGPVVAEPFLKELGDLADDDARLAATRASLRAIGF